MLNYIWLGLILLAVLIGGLTDHLQDVATKGFEMAKFAVMDTALPLVGIMALWLGIMRLAERAGLVALLGRGLRPLLRHLFPDVPPDHPALGSIVLNMAANMLGLGNAATPLGLRAMKDLESLNPHPGVATNAMCTFLAINTSSVQLIPVTAIAIMAANHSSNPTAIVGTSLLATGCGALAGVSMAKLLQRLPRFRAPSASERPSVGRPSGRAEPAATGEKLEALEAPGLQPLSWWGWAIMLGYTVFFAYLLVRTLFSDGGSAVSGGATNPPVAIRAVDAVSKLAIPFVLAGFPLYAALRRVRVYEEFVVGAKEGLEVALRIIPYLVAILVAIGMFRAAGGIEWLGQLLGPLLRALRLPVDLLPLVLLRPLSGSGTLGVLAEIVKHHGPDHLVSRMAGTIYGSTETTFYVLAVYFGSVSIQRPRHAVVAGLTADAVGVVASVIVCRAVFG